MVYLDYLSNRMIYIRKNFILHIYVNNKSADLMNEVQHFFVYNKTVFIGHYPSRFVPDYRIDGFLGQRYG